MVDREENDEGNDTHFLYFWVAGETQRWYSWLFECLSMQRGDPTLFRLIYIFIWGCDQHGRSSPGWLDCTKANLFGFRHTHPFIIKTMPVFVPEAPGHHFCQYHIRHNAKRRADNLATDVVETLSWIEESRGPGTWKHPLTTLTEMDCFRQEILGLKPLKGQTTIFSKIIKWTWGLKCKSQKKPLTEATAQTINTTFRVMFF